MTVTYTSLNDNVTVDDTNIKIKLIPGAIASKDIELFQIIGHQSMENTPQPSINESSFSSLYKIKTKYSHQLGKYELVVVYNNDYDITLYSDQNRNISFTWDSGPYPDSNVNFTIETVPTPTKVVSEFLSANGIINVVESSVTFIDTGENFDSTSILNVDITKSLTLNSNGSNHNVFNVHGLINLTNSNINEETIFGITGIVTDTNNLDGFYLQYINGNLYYISTNPVVYGSTVNYVIVEENLNGSTQKIKIIFTNKIPESVVLDNKTVVLTPGDKVTLSGEPALQTYNLDYGIVDGFGQEVKSIQTALIKIDITKFPIAGDVLFSLNRISFPFGIVGDNITITEDLFNSKLLKLRNLKYEVDNTDNEKVNLILDRAPETIVSPGNDSFTIEAYDNNESKYYKVNIDVEFSLPLLQYEVFVTDGLSNSMYDKDTKTITYNTIWTQDAIIGYLKTDRPIMTASDSVSVYKFVNETNISDDSIYKYTYEIQLDNIFNLTHEDSVYKSESFSKTDFFYVEYDSNDSDKKVNIIYNYTFPQLVNKYSVPYLQSSTIEWNYKLKAYKIQNKQIYIKTNGNEDLINEINRPDVTYGSIVSVNNLKQYVPIEFTYNINGVENTEKFNLYVHDGGDESYHDKIIETTGTNNIEMSEKASYNLIETQVSTAEDSKDEQYDMSSSGDPHVFPLQGSPFELSMKETNFRMLQSSKHRFIINASTRKIKENENDDIVRYYKKHFPQYVNRILTNGYFYNKCFIFNEGVTLEYDFDTNKIIADKGFNYNVHTRTVRNANLSQYETDVRVYEKVIEFYNHYHKNVKLVCRIFNNPYLKYGLALRMDNVKHAKGLLIRESNVQNMELEYLGSTEHKNELKVPNPVYTKLSTDILRH